MLGGLMANPAPERCQTQSHKTSVSPNPELLLQKNLCAEPGCSAAETQEKPQSGGSRGTCAPKQAPTRPGGSGARQEMCPVPLGVRAPHLAGLRWSLLARVPGAQPPTSPRRGAEAGWETAALGRTCSGAGIYPCWHLPCPLLPLNPGSDMPFRAIPCCSVPSHAVPRHPTLSCAHSSPAKIISCQFPTQVPIPPPPPAPLGAQAGQDFCGNPQGLTITPAAQGPGNSCHGFLLRSRDWLCFLGEHRGWLCIWGGLGAVFGEDRGCLCFWGHKGWYCLWRGCWGWLRTWGTQGLALPLRGDSFGDARAGFAFWQTRGLPLV